jgi:hypothetical protein
LIPQQVSGNAPAAGAQGCDQLLGETEFVDEIVHGIEGGSRSHGIAVVPVATLRITLH